MSAAASSPAALILVINFSAFIVIGFNYRTNIILIIDITTTFYNFNITLT